MRWRSATRTVIVAVALERLEVVALLLEHARSCSI
jgi:hypothetical protein